MGDEKEEEKNSHETMDDEENRKRGYIYQKNESNPSYHGGTSPDVSEEIHQYFSDSDDSKRPLMEKVQYLLMSFLEIHLWTIAQKSSLLLFKALLRHYPFS